MFFCIVFLSYLILGYLMPKTLSKLLVTAVPFFCAPSNLFSMNHYPMPQVLGQSERNFIYQTYGERVDLDSLFVGAEVNTVIKINREFDNFITANMTINFSRRLGYLIISYVSVYKGGFPDGGCEAKVVKYENDLYSYRNGLWVFIPPDLLSWQNEE